MNRNHKKEMADTPLAIVSNCNLDMKVELGWEDCRKGFGKNAVLFFYQQIQVVNIYEDSQLC